MTASTKSANCPAPKAPAPPLPFWQTLGVSGFAGVFGWCFTHPFEMWKNTVMMAPPGTSQLDSLKTTARKGFYTGLSSGLMRQVVYTTARLGCYPTFRDGILQGEVAVGLKKSADPSGATALDRALAGASAGVFASFLSSPVEVCLVLQTTNKGKEKLSMLQALKVVLQSRGVTGLWSGIGALSSRAALVGVSQVAVHDQVLTMLRARNVKRAEPLNDNLVVNIASVITAFICSIVTMPMEVARVRMSAEAKVAMGLKKSADPSGATALDRALAGASAGVFASFLSSPVEVCLVLQTTNKGKEKLSMLQALKVVLQSRGVTGLWSGIGALSSRAALVGVSQVAVHDQVLTMLRARNVKRADPLNDNLVVNIASVITAFICSIVTMPMEVARVRMSAEAKLSAGMEKRYRNVVQCIGRIFKEEGLLAMYDSYLPYFGRCASQTVICFFVIEYLTRQLRERQRAKANSIK
ncbi:hypothetical protein LSCM4_07128 [Leishmania orientalis]|uniref:Mitochondrial carrier protein n=1 Tax=Leishmania orientalis TaxID=2249476 RepID=A0A836KNY8_9TRYP|nr:hypothetical protein LSCM4_07128 [Leishmania orientalis]